jgi:hypothetical protein
MKKLMLVVAMLAIVLVAAAPAIAQGVGQEFSERRNTSGSSSPKVVVSNTGDNANLCPSVQQLSQTGQVLNEQGVVQYFSTADDLDFSGSSITIGTESAPADLTASCTQTTEQSSASS